MASIGTLTLTGKSGRSYEFSVYPRSTSFRAVGGVYVMSKRNALNRQHSVLYIGQTEDLSSRPLNHHRTSAFDRYGADHVNVIVVEDKARRCAIELDLIHAFDPVCNKQAVPIR